MTLFEAADVTVIEDDVFGEFEREPAPRLAALDGLRRVIALGGFSKTLSAAARCGYVAARRELIEPLIDIQAAAHFSGSALAQETVLRALQDGAYRKSVAALRDRIAKASPRVARALESAGLRLWTSPRAGLFLWARLPDGMDAAALARRGLTQDVVLAPGNVFSASGSAREFLRFNVAQSDDPRIFVFLKNEIEDWTRDPASWDRDAPSSPAS
jgi:DNA-binding transcriptional MocR family regulator